MDQVQQRKRFPVEIVGVIITFALILLLVLKPSLPFLVGEPEEVLQEWHTFDHNPANQTIVVLHEGECQYLWNEQGFDQFLLLMPQDWESDPLNYPCGDGSGSIYRYREQGGANLRTWVDGTPILFLYETVNSDPEAKTMTIRYSYWPIKVPSS